MTGAGDPTRELLDRIRSLLPDDHLREVRMFGVTAVMVNDAMAVAVGKDGRLLVRVDPAEDAALLAKPGTSRAEMGTGRSMGEGWIRVDADAVRSPTSLADWVQAATRFLDRKNGAGSP
jgi:TfoX/Sxy family transcriptional regulator of competence genes